MLAPEPSSPNEPDRRWDVLTGHLHELRTDAGEPSFGDIAQRVATARESRGVSPHAARVARSTVYDCFRTGRSRINLPFVREIALVLGATDSQVDQWIAESQAGPRARPAYVEESEPPPATTRQALQLMVACLVLNLAGREFVDFFQFPIYLDMTGTAIVAIALGPWRGAAVGAATNIVGIVGSGWISLPFGLVNVVGALVWGYGVRRWGMGRTLPRFFLLNIGVAVSCTMVAVPVIVTFLGGEARAGHDIVTQLVEESIDTFLLAVGFSNILTSLTDKLISGFIAMVAISALPTALRYHSNLMFVSAPPESTGGES